MPVKVPSVVKEQVNTNRRTGVTVIGGFAPFGELSVAEDYPVVEAPPVVKEFTLFSPNVIAGTILAGIAIWANWK